MRMLVGVWNSHDSAMISNVTHSACGRPGSLSVARQLANPLGVITPRVSHVVKLRPRTPSSGTMPNATNIASAGNAIHATRPWPPAVDADRVVRADDTAAGATMVTCR